MKPKSEAREKPAPPATASADDVIEFTTRLTTDPVTGEKRMLTTAGPAASARDRLLCAIDLARRSTASDPQNLYCRQATLILDAAYKDEAGNAEGGPAASAEKPKYAVGVSVLLTRGSQLLLGKRKNVSAAGLYSTPGGRIEPDENMAQCAIREFNEETGAVLGGFMFIDFREHMRFGHHYFMFYAHADSYEGEITNTQPDKCEGWEWFDLARLPENCTEPPEVIEKLNRLMPAASVKHICAQDDRKLPIDRPCSACSGGDPEMKYHDHCPPFRQTAASAEPRTQQVKDFYAALGEIDRLRQELARLRTDRDNWQATASMATERAEKAEQERDGLRGLIPLIEAVLWVFSWHQTHHEACTCAYCRLRSALAALPHDKKEDALG